MKKKISSFILIVLLLGSVSFIPSSNAWHVIGHVPDIDGGCVPAPGLPCDTDVPTFPSAPLNFDTCYKIANSDSEAGLECFYQLLQKDQSDVSAIDQMVKIYYFLERYEDAGRWTENALKRDSNYLENSNIPDSNFKKMCLYGYFNFCGSIGKQEEKEKEERKETIPIPTAKIGAYAAVTGKVEVQRLGTNVWTSVGTGMAVYSYDKLRTSDNGRAQIMLLDDTVFTVGPKTELILDEFVFDPDSNFNKLSAQLLKGVFRFVTGKIARKNPEDVKIVTPSGGIGIRGTDFVLNYFPSSGLGRVVVFGGAVEVTPNNGKYYWTIEEGYGANFDSNEVLGQFVVDQEIRYKALANLDPNGNIESYNDSGGGGCLIATATFDSELAPQVQMLREIRDNSLLQTESGTSFMKSFNDFYYSFSPIIADYERENPVFKEAVKLAITPMISSLSILNYVDMDSEESVLGYGISLILLNVVIYVGIPAIVIVGIRKRF